MFEFDDTIMMAEEDYNDMCYDISYLSALCDLLTEALAENGVELVFADSKIYERARELEAGSGDTQ